MRESQSSPTEAFSLPEAGEEKYRRAEIMLQALRDALDQVYDADCDQQLHKLAHDYCSLVGEPACHYDLCSPLHPHPDCPLLQDGERDQLATRLMPPL